MPPDGGIPLCPVRHQKWAQKADDCVAPQRSLPRLAADSPALALEAHAPCRSEESANMGHWPTTAFPITSTQGDCAWFAPAKSKHEPKMFTAFSGQNYISTRPKSYHAAEDTSRVAGAPKIPSHITTLKSHHIMFRNNSLRTPMNPAKSTFRQ